MKVAGPIVSLVALVASVAASPVADMAELDTRQVVLDEFNITLYANKNFGGDSEEMVVTEDICKELPEVWQGDVGSFKMGAANWCTIYRHSKCTGVHQTFTSDAGSLKVMLRLYSRAIKCG